MVALDRGPSERFTASSSGEDLPTTTTAWGKHNGRLFVRGHFPGHWVRFFGVKVWSKICTEDVCALANLANGKFCTFSSDFAFELGRGALQWFSKRRKCDGVLASCWQFATFEGQLGRNPHCWLGAKISLNVEWVTILKQLLLPFCREDSELFDFKIYKMTENWSERSRGCTLIFIHF